MSLILSHSGQESIQTSTVSLYENTTLPANLPKDVSKLGIFSGACIGKIDGCTFTFNIAREKKKAQTPRSPRKFIEDFIIAESFSLNLFATLTIRTVVC